MDNFNILNIFEYYTVFKIVLGALVVTLGKGIFKYKEDGFLERTLTGGDPDPYILISVLENEDSTPPENLASKIFKKFSGEETQEPRKFKKNRFARVLDSGISTKKVSTCFCVLLCTCYAVLFWVILQLV